ncbi:MAG: 2,3-bisphosphoglycerate-independent phosphoglycerate mutase [Oscillospiraceae bacterium]|nr:2,3-bisphosphoglycerate-independent phosphoglycerate mutase [Oscillospiraceae bacterium]
MKDKRPVVLLIMDGFGLAEPSDINAVSLAKTPVLDGLFASCPHTELQASGEDVGLPAGQIGNSEVGHTNIGAGRVVYQDLPRISRAVADGSFFENPAYAAAMDEAAQTGHPVHVLGLLSDGGVHSHISHLFALVEMAKRRGVKQCYVHAFLDGRDVPPASGAGYVRALEEEFARLGYGRLATVQGRFWAMDRDKRWERLERAYRAIVCGEGIQNPDGVQAVENSYAAGVTDEFVEPVVCDPAGLVSPGDSVIFLNFRPDRAREMTWALMKPDFDGFQRPKGFFPLHYVCTAQYDETMTELPVAFPPETIEDTFGELLSRMGKTQLRIAETEKYAHVTFFFNGGVERESPGEDRVLVPSPKEFPTYDLIPEMSAYTVTEKAVECIASGAYDAVIMNLANCDMVGHTGDLNAAIKAVETVDTCVGRVQAAVEQAGGVLLVTADHGNADCMRLPDGTPHTAHTTNPVPLILAGGGEVKLKPGRLADIAPTMLALMGLEQPEKMTGESLILNA